MTYQETKAIGIHAEPETRKTLSRRSHLEIRMDMLRAVMEGAEGPTQIMYKANLSWVLLCEHLHALEALGFLDESTNGNRKKYSLTEKGLNIVRSYLDVVKEIEMSPSAAPRVRPNF